MVRSSESYWETKEARTEEITSEAVDTVLKHGEKGRPRLEDFSDVFTPEEIARDRQTVARLRRERAAERLRLRPEERARKEAAKRRAEALEIILEDQAELNEWLGKRASLVRATEYDDGVNHVDAVAEFDEGEGAQPERVALALDASTGQGFSLLARKIERNVAMVRGEGAEAKVKYFQSPVTGRKERLSNVIPVVVGVAGANAEKLIASFAEIIKLRQARDKAPAIHARLKATIESMRTHPVQVVFLEEIETQLALYAALLAKSGARSRPETREGVQKLLGIVHAVMDTKVTENIHLGKWGEDRVLGTIREVVKEMGA